MDRNELNRQIYEAVDVALYHADRAIERHSPRAPLATHGEQDPLIFYATQPDAFWQKVAACSAIAITPERARDATLRLYTILPSLDGIHQAVRALRNPNVPLEDALELAHSAIPKFAELIQALEPEDDALELAERLQTASDKFANLVKQATPPNFHVNGVVPQKRIGPQSGSPTPAQ